MKHRVFTLIELLIVIVIISILIVVGQVSDYKINKFQDLQKKSSKQKEYIERLHNQA
jgi:prepilin-type N-terminal cleavage/methylation domain-containing protein